MFGRKREIEYGVLVEKRKRKGSPSYYPRQISLTNPANETMYEFLIVGDNIVGAFEKITSIFSAHKVDLTFVYGAVYGKREFVKSIYADFAYADCTSEKIAEEIESLDFVSEIRYANTKARFYSSFLFPLLIRNKHRGVLLRLEGLLNVEKNIEERMGSAGEAIMFEEGKSYFSFGVNALRELLPLEKNILTRNIEDLLRTNGWGIVQFTKESQDLVEITVQDPPLRTVAPKDQTEKEKHEPSKFFVGMLAAAVEGTYEWGEVAVRFLDYDEKTKILRVRFGPRERN